MTQALDSRPALILVNLGTPATPTPGDVRRFLRAFLTDRRVVETSPLLWRPVLEGAVLRLRPRSSAAKYASIWRAGHEHEHIGSPLMHASVAQGRLLQQVLGQDVEVAVAMRYGPPSLREVMAGLLEAGHRRIAVLPVYPQYAASCQASVLDEVARLLLRVRDQPELRTVRSFPTAPAYIEALATAVENHWAAVGRPDPRAGARLILSFHSIPRAMHDAGDPYRSECRATARALARRLDLPEGLMEVGYQSVFGPAHWIGPATIDIASELGRQGCPRLDVVCPGFMADCLETLEEIDQLNREAFVSRGGGAFHYVPWGNDSQGAVATLAEQARTALAGWVSP
ncbi:MAG: ferrochelatase [Actinomyces sp.]|uniref:ferrochelatase n=1 Tax=Actinomyces sp. TaxID=29317 RepID=UPI0026DACB4F|nr:ferrochelatase [Actinomyces sp.]MDO4243011.1 ferrochelatase [Actinomyces sp.]